MRTLRQNWLRKKSHARKLHQAFEALGPRVMLTANYFIAGDAHVLAGASYTLTLQTDSTSLRSWDINWGDGTIASPDENRIE